jgi:hypothetical protein
MKFSLVPYEFLQQTEMRKQWIKLRSSVSFPIAKASFHKALCVRCAVFRPGSVARQTVESFKFTLTVQRTDYLPASTEAMLVKCEKLVEKQMTQH